jgi:hypothetical protein
MKKIILGSLIGICFTTIFAFTVVNYEPKRSTAEVEQYQGLYIFVDSKPVIEYEYLGTVKGTLTFGDTQYTGCRNRMIKKCKKEYPNADGLIITFKSGGTDMADAIKLK